MISDARKNIEKNATSMLTLKNDLFENKNYVSNIQKREWVDEAQT